MSTQVETAGDTTTREQRIERAAWLCENYDSYDIFIAPQKCRIEGISDEEIKEGRKLADERREAFFAKFRYERYGR